MRAVLNIENWYEDQVRICFPNYFSRSNLFISKVKPKLEAQTNIHILHLFIYLFIMNLIRR